MQRAKISHSQLRDNRTNSLGVTAQDPINLKNTNTDLLMQGTASELANLSDLASPLPYQTSEMPSMPLPSGSEQVYLLNQ